MINLKHNISSEQLNDLKVYVYFNLHKKCFSVKALSGDLKGLVIAHTNSINLDDVTFKVSEAGRQRVLIEKKKNVHAGVVGTFKGFIANEISEYKQAYYNPYKTTTFLNGTDSLYNADKVTLTNKTINFK